MAFHWRGGTHFERQGDGAVKIWCEQGLGRHDFSVVIPASEWASIVAAVSARGENGDTYRTALKFHDTPGAPGPTPPPREPPLRVG